MDSIAVDDLKIKPKKGGYSRGRDGYEQVLYATLDILIEDGYRAITFRKVAKACDMNVGNVHYYFKTKESLIRELLDALIASYVDEFDRILATTKRGGERKLQKYITLVINDIASKKTTRIFPELWALANHDAFIAERVQEMYRRVRESLHNIIEELNPELSKSDCETLALFISASMEGLTVFAGHEKPWRDQLPALKNIAIQSFTHAIKTITSKDIHEKSESALTLPK